MHPVAERYAWFVVQELIVSFACKENERWILCMKERSIECRRTVLCLVQRGGNERGKMEDCMKRFFLLGAPWSIFSL
jgi:hypothetical protein